MWLLFKTRSCLLHTIMKGELGLKKVCRNIPDSALFCVKKLHGFVMQSSVWRVNIFHPQLPKMSSSFSQHFHSILCPLPLKSIFICINQCLFPLDSTFWFCLSHETAKLPNYASFFLCSSFIQNSLISHCN